MAKAANKSVPSRSTLDRLSGGLIEACWLGAAITIPLLHTSQGRDGFEPFKVEFLRLIALIMFAALAVRLAGCLQVRTPSFGRRLKTSFIPLLIAGAILGVSIILSGFFSVFPLQSFWGSFQQRQGLLTELSCGVVLLGAGLELRTPDQVRRLCAALIVPTIPVSLITFMQRAGADPLRFFSSGGGRVFGLEGNPVSLAAYLEMIMPFTLLRISELWEGLRQEKKRVSIVVIVYGVVFLLQAAAFVLAESRGPLLALIAGASFAGLVLAARSSRKTLTAFVAAVVVVVSFLVVLGIPKGPLAPLARLPVVNRLAQTLPRSVPSDEGRIALWNEAFNLLISRESVAFPSGITDRWNGLRPLLGYGPETLEGILPLRMTLGSPAPPLMSRFHNYVWDRWYSYGILGLSGFVALVGSAAAVAFCKLGMLRTRRDGTVFCVSLAFSMTLGAVAMIWHLGAKFLGLGLGLGLPAGIGSYAIIWNVFLAERTDERDPIGGYGLFILALLSLVVMHLVETSFAFPISTTSLLFWLSLGIILGFPVEGRVCEWEPQQKTDGTKPSFALRSLVISAALATLTMIPVIFALVGLVSFEPLEIGSILTSSLRHTNFGAAQSHQVEWVLIPTWIYASFAYAASVCPGRSLASMPGAFLGSLCVSAVAGALCAFLKAEQIAAVSHVGANIDPVAAAHQIGVHCQVMLTGIFAGIVVFVVILAAGCQATGDSTAALCRKEEIVPGSIAVVGCFGLAWFGSLRPATADAFAGLANALNRTGRLSTSVEAYRLALVFNPNSSAYRFEAIQLIEARAESSRNHEAFDADMRLAENISRDGLAICPLDPQGALMLGTIYERWAAGENDPVRRSVIAQKARISFTEARHFKPVEIYALINLGAVDSALIGDAASAREEVTLANNLIPERLAGDWFDALSRLSEQSTTEQLGLYYERVALDCCDRAIDEAIHHHLATFSLKLRKGIFYYSVGQLKPAVAAFFDALAAGHDEDEWKAEGFLAHAFSDLGDWDAAVAHMSRAVAIAPDPSKVVLRTMLDKMHMHETH